MDIIAQFQQLVGARAAYPIIAALLTFALQIGKSSPYTKVLYAKTPDGWKWLLPIIAGGTMGFVHGYQAGYTLTGSLVEMVFGIFGVGATAMGINAGLKESALPWSGGAGGKKPPADEPRA